MSFDRYERKYSIGRKFDALEFLCLFRNSNSSLWGPLETAGGGPPEISGYWGSTTEKH